MGLIFSQMSSLVQLIWQLHCDPCQQNGEKGREPGSALCQSVRCKLDECKVCLCYRIKVAHPDKYKFEIKRGPRTWNEVIPKQ